MGIFCDHYVLKVFSLLSLFCFYFSPFACPPYPSLPAYLLVCLLLIMPSLLSLCLSFHFFLFLPGRHVVSPLFSLHFGHNVV